MIRFIIVSVFIILFSISFMASVVSAPIHTFSNAIKLVKIIIWPFLLWEAILMFQREIKYFIKHKLGILKFGKFEIQSNNIPNITKTWEHYEQAKKFKYIK